MPLVNLNKKLNRLEKRNFSWKERVRSPKILIVCLLLFIFGLLPLGSACLAARATLAGARQISAAFKQENLGQIKEGVVHTKRSLDWLDTSLNFLVWLRVIPFLGGYYADAKHFARATSLETGATQTIILALMPYEKELGFTGQPTPGQDKIAQAIKVLDKALPFLNQVEPDLKKAADEVKNISSSKYPSWLGLGRVQEKVEQAKNFIIGAHIAVSEGREALEIAPSALGQGVPKNYLLLFQNDKELRATGGFITAYAFLKLDEGHISTTSSDDIYRLDERLLNVCLSKICPLTPPAPIVKYLPEVSGKARSAWSMRDSNLSPDLPTSAQEFKRMYELLGEGIPFDGIIYIDTQVVEELIALTGPVDVFGTTYSAQKDKRCNCPNVIYELEHYAEIASKGESDRKAILGTLMQQILARILGSGMDKLPAFVNSAVQLANDKHIMIYMNDGRSQEAISKLNWTGQIKTPEGDYLHINDSNFAGGKSNLYVEEKVILEIKIDKEGSVTHKVNIEYKNPEAYSSWLNGILRDYVRVYVPKGSKLLSSKGSEDQVNTLDDEKLDKTYFEAFIQVRPQNSTTLSFEYTLPDKTTGKNYPLLIQKQPGAKDHKYIVKINSSKKAEFNLTSDKILNLSF